MGFGPWGSPILKSATHLHSLLLLSPPPLGATKMAYPSIPAISEVMYDRPFRLAPSLDRPTPLPEENVEFMIQEAIETGKEGEEMDCL